MKLFIMHFSPVYYQFLLDPNIFLCNLFLNTLNLFFALNVRDKFYTHAKEHKIGT